MRITDLLRKESIELNTSVNSKNDAIDKLVSLQIKGGNISDAEAYKKGILTREKMSSIAIGDGIAIPRAAADPLHVIPSCLVGSAAAGALSAFFKCTLMAPHGGVFVFAVVGHWPLYILSLAVGSVVGMLMLRLLKKNVNKDQ